MVLGSKGPSTAPVRIIRSEERAAS